MHKDAGPPKPHGPGSRCSYLLRAAQPQRTGSGTRTAPPPPTKGRQLALRVARGRRVAQAPPRVPAPRARICPGHWRRRPAWSMRCRRVWSALPGPLRPRAPPLPHLPAAGDMFRPPPVRRTRPPQGPPTARPVRRRRESLRRCHRPDSPRPPACPPTRSQEAVAASQIPGSGSGDALGGLSANNADCGQGLSSSAEAHMGKGLSTRDAREKGT